MQSIKVLPAGHGDLFFLDLRAAAVSHHHATMDRDEVKALMQSCRDALAAKRDDVPAAHAAT